VYVVISCSWTAAVPNCYASTVPSGKTAQSIVNKCGFTSFVSQEKLSYCYCYAAGGNGNVMAPCIGLERCVAGNNDVRKCWQRRIIRPHIKATSWSVVVRRRLLMLKRYQREMLRDGPVDAAAAATRWLVGIIIGRNDSASELNRQRPTDRRANDVNLIT